MPLLHDSLIYLISALHQRAVFYCPFLDFASQTENSRMISCHLSRSSGVFYVRDGPTQVTAQLLDLQIQVVDLAAQQPCLDGVHRGHNALFLVQQPLVLPVWGHAAIQHMLNVPNLYAQKRGGWATPNTMRKVYQHTMDSKRSAVDAQIDSFFESLL